MTTPAAYLILPAAVALDLLIGDPRGLPHPVRWMGRAIAAAEPVFRRLPVSPRKAGIAFAFTLAAGTGLAAAALVGLARAVHPLLGAAVEMVMIYYCIATRSLRDAAMAVYDGLSAGDTERARAAIRITGIESRAGMKLAASSRRAAPVPNSRYRSLR